MTTRGLGYKPDATRPNGRDLRDRPFAIHRAASLAPGELEWVDAWSIPAKDQLRTSSCVGNAATGVVRRASLINGIDCPELSAQAVYRGCLNIDKSNTDSGTYLHSAIQVLQKFGAPSEAIAPFSEAEILNQITVDAAQDAFDRRGVRGYYRVADGSVSGVASALAGRLGLISGWDVSERFVMSDGLEIFDPPTSRDVIAGGHAMGIVARGSSDAFAEKVPGFNTNGKFYAELYMLLGSWGSAYGHNGRIFVTPEFIAQARDVWAIDLQEEP